MGRLTISLSSVFNNASAGLPSPTLAEQVAVQHSQVQSGINRTTAALQTQIIVEGLSSGHISNWRLLAAQSEADLTASIEKSYLNAKREVALLFDEGRAKLGFERLYNEPMPLVK